MTKVFTPEEIAAQKVAIEFVQDVTPRRLEQMLAETFDTLNGGEPDVRKLGLFLKAVANDIYKEELLRINELDLDRHTINPLINQIAKVWFFERIAL